MDQNKSFRGFLVLNWKNGAMRVTKRKPTNESPYEISVNFSIGVTLPEKPAPSINAKIELPETKVNTAIAEEI